jgi:leucyl aminopeptidase
VRTPGFVFPAQGVAGVFLLFLIPAATVAAQAPVAGPDEQWITIGADAFDALNRPPAFSYGARPLRKTAQREGVVLTRVRGSDLSAISQRVHTVLGRCAGFMAHPNFEDASRVVEAVGAPRAQRLGSAYVIDQPALVMALQAQLSTAPIVATIGHLSEDFANRYYAHADGAAAAQWIYSLWEGYATGRPDVTVELFDHPWLQSSVILTIDGSLYPDEVVVLGGHLDSITPSNGSSLAPGADDDASGIATLSEVLRAAMALGFQPERTVKFMGYSAEEVGLDGSQEIAAAYQSAAIDVVAVLQLDMTAYNGSTEDVLLISDYTDTALTDFLGALLDTYQPELAWSTTACGYACSDHASWNFRGFPASFAFESRFGQHNPEIHTTDDVLATFGSSADHAIKFARLATAFMVEVAMVTPPGWLFGDGFESGSTSAWSQTLP